MTRNKTNLLCVMARKNRPQRKETSIPSSEQEVRAGFMVVTQERSNSHPSGRVTFLPSKRVEAYEVRLKSMLSVFLNSEAVLWKEFFSSAPACESTVLHWSTKGIYGSCWEKNVRQVAYIGLASV